MTSLTSGGSWTNDQHTGEAVDPTGLTFEVHYADGTSASVSPQAHTPSVWGDTAGTQTCTFTYTEDGESVSCAVEATVVDATSLTSLTISGSLTNDQFVGHAPDITGLTVTAHYSDSTLDHAVDSADLTVAPAEYDEAGAQTLSISYTDEYGTASATQSVTVLAVELASLNISGTPATQVIGLAPDLTGLTFTAVYSDASEESVASTDITVSPATWATTGSQTLTCSYTEDEVTVSDTVSVTVDPVTVTSISYSGTLPTQYLGGYEDFTGMTFTFGYNNGQSLTVTAQEVQDAWDLGTGSYLNAYSPWINQEDWTWQEYQGSTVATLTLEPDTYEGNYWTANSIAIASPTPQQVIENIQLQPGL